MSAQIHKDRRATYMKDLLTTEMRIIGNQEGIFEKPQKTYASGTAKPYSWICPLKGCHGPSYGATVSYSLSMISFLIVSTVVEVLFRGRKRAVGAGADWSAKGFGMLK
jgi:hypothetical protein